MLESEFQQEIKDLNLNYLVLAKTMIMRDKESAMYRLGVTSEVADTIGSLSTSQMIDMAASRSMITRFRFDDEQVLRLLATEGNKHELSYLHPTMLMSGQDPADIHSI